MSVPALHRPRRLTAIAAAIALAGGLAACSSPEGGDGDETTDATGDGAVNVSGTTISVVDGMTDDPDNGILGDALDTCAGQLGVTYERESVPGSHLIARVLQQASSRTLPDLLLIDNPDLQQIASTGALRPLDEAGVSSEGFIEGIIGAGTYEDVLYGLAPGVNTLSLYVNTDLLEAAGVEAPTTWEELTDAAATLTSGDTYGLAFSAPANYEGAWQFLPFFWTAGAEETDITSDAAVEALELWVDLVSAGSVSQSVVNWTQADVKDQFAAGKAAMMVNGPWQLTPLDEIEGLNYQVVPIPVPETGMTSVAPLGGEVWTLPVSGDAAREAASAEMLNCLLSDELMVSYSAARHYIPPKPALAATYLEQVAEPQMTGFVDQVATARSRTGILGERWPATAEALWTAVGSAMTGQTSPADALESAAAELS